MGGSYLFAVNIVSLLSTTDKAKIKMYFGSGLIWKFSRHDIYFDEFLIDVRFDKSFSFFFIKVKVSFHTIVANIMDCNMVISKFELQLNCYVHFTLRKVWNFLYPAAQG